MIRKTLVAVVILTAAFASLTQKTGGQVRRGLLAPQDGTFISPQLAPGIVQIPSMLTVPEPPKPEVDARVKQWMERYRRFGLDAGIAELILKTADKYDIPPRIAFGLVRVESEFYPRALSYAGARGLSQVMLGTARYRYPNIQPEELYDPGLNLDIGFAHLRFLLRYYDGNVRRALLGYNRGHGTVDRVLRAGGDPSNGYARMVLGE